VEAGIVEKPEHFLYSRLVPEYVHFTAITIKLRKSKLLQAAAATTNNNSDCGQF